MQMQRLMLLAILFATASPWVAAQAARFDVASVRAGGTPGSYPSVSVMPGGRISAPNVSVRELIRNAYGMVDNGILGGAEWIDRERLGVEAKAARADATPSKLQARLAALRCEQVCGKVRGE